MKSNCHLVAHLMVKQSSELEVPFEAFYWNIFNLLTPGRPSVEHYPEVFVCFLANYLRSYRSTKTSLNLVFSLRRKYIFTSTRR